MVCHGFTWSVALTACLCAVATGESICIRGCRVFGSPHQWRGGSRVWGKGNSYNRVRAANQNGSRGAVDVYYLFVYLFHFCHMLHIPLSVCFCSVLCCYVCLYTSRLSPNEMNEWIVRTFVNTYCNDVWAFQCQSNRTFSATRSLTILLQTRVYHSKTSKIRLLRIVRFLLQKLAQAG